MNTNPLDFCFKNVSYLSEIQKQTANSLVTETLQYFVFFCRSAYFTILAKCLIINGLRLILTILFLTAFLNITHTARHTWATLSYHLGIPVGVISEALGHSSVRVTETYLKPFENERVDNANDKLINSITKRKGKYSSFYNRLQHSLL